MEKKLKLDTVDKERLTHIAEEVFHRLEKGMTLKEATGISDDALEEIYGLAHSYYELGKYKESVSLFQFLAGASPTTYKYLLGLGASFHQMGLYRDAAYGFCMAFQADPQNPISLYHATDCLLKLGLGEEAKSLSEIAIEVCEEHPGKYDQLAEKCRLIINS